MSDFNVAPGGYWLYRSTNSHWQGNAASGAESYGAGPHQHTVDFDLLGDSFIVGFGGALGSTGVGGTGFKWSVRIGGAYALDSDGLQPITGDYVEIGDTGIVPAFGSWMIYSDPVINIWDGVKIVKLTGLLPGGGGFSLNPTLIFFPAA